MRFESHLVHRGNVEVSFMLSSKCVLAGTALALLSLGACTVNTAPPAASVAPPPSSVVVQQPAPPPSGTVVVQPRPY